MGATMVLDDKAEFSHEDFSSFFGGPTDAGGVVRTELVTIGDLFDAFEAALNLPEDSFTTQGPVAFVHPPIPEGFDYASPPALTVAAHGGLTINLADRMNVAYFPFLHDARRMVVMRGGAGSGKSVAATEKILARIISEPGHCFLVLRKIARTLRESVWKEFKRTISRWGVAQHFEISVSPMAIRYKPNGSEIIFAGLDDPEKMKSIAGITGAWCEEATEFTEDDINQLDLRLRGPTPSYKQIILSFNPISQYHWLKKRLFDSPAPQTEGLYLTTYRDNRFIDADYAERIEALREKNPQLYRVYGLGEWGVLEGLIYDIWPVEDLPREADESIYGLDFGFNHPTALIRIFMIDGRPYVREEIFESGLTTGDMIAQMREIGVDEETPIYADPAEPDRIEEIRREGFNIQPAEKGKGSVLAGIDVVKSYRPRIIPGSPNLVKENQSYSWAKHRDGRTLDEPVKEFDHGMDAIRYGLTMLKKRGGGFGVHFL